MEAKEYIKSLVHRVTKADVFAMRTLYEKYAKEMLATSFRITNDLQASEDIIQESFVVSFQKITQLKEANKYGDWLKRIVTNKSIAKIKKNIHYREVELTIDIAEQKEDRSKKYSFAQLQKVIHELPEGCRQVFSLHLLDNYKHQEIAEILQISISTSKSQYQYALKLLRQRLNPEYND